MAEAYRAH